MSATATTARPVPGSRRRPHGLDAFAATTLLLAGAGLATHSVVRYRWWIVAGYAVLAAALLGTAARGARMRSAARRVPSPLTSRRPAAVALVLAAVLTWRVHCFTYLAPGEARTVRVVATLAALCCAGLIAARWRHAPDAALAVAVAAHVTMAALLIRWDPAPRIDVWVTLQQGSDALRAGENLYTQHWHGSPGVQDAFTYLPWMAVVLAPGRLLAGDVRWALLAVTVLTALAVRALGGRAAALPAASAAALLLLLPGTATQVEQAWTEPVLLACLAGWVLALRSGTRAGGVLALGLGLACKQHLALLLPAAAAWRRFGPRATLAAGAVAALGVLPWFLVDPGAMWHDTVKLLVDFPPLVRADTLYLLAMHELGWTPPFWLTGALVVAVVAASAVAVRRLSTSPGQVLRWFAAVLLVANLVNKQAFYNQYWLVMGLVLLSWASDGRDDAELSPGPDRPGGGEAARPAPANATSG